MASRTRYSPNLILLNLRYADFIDDRYTAALREHADAILPAIRDMAATAAGQVGVNACHVLLQLGEISGTDGLLARIANGSAEEQLSALRCIAHLPYQRDKGGIQVALDKATVLPVAASFLDSPNSELRYYARLILEKLDTPEAGEILLGLIRSPDPEIRTEIVRWLTWNGRDDGALDTIDELLFETAPVAFHRHYWLVHGLESLCRHVDAAVRQRACDLAIRYLRAVSSKTDNDTANNARTCLKAVIAAQPDDEPAILAEVLNSQLMGWVRGEALIRLAELEGDRGLTRLCDALKDSELRSAAAEGLTACAKNSSDATILTRIGEALAAETDQHVIAKMAEAFVAAGGTSRNLLRDVMAKADAHTAMTIHWMLKRIEPKDVIETLIAAGAAPTAICENTAKYEENWRDKRHAFHLLLGILADAEALAWPIIKTDMVPADHVDAIERICKASGAELPIEDATQSVDADGHLHVRFIYDGRPFTLKAEQLGRYLDLPALMNGLNAALQAVGHKKRFFQLTGEGEVAFIVFAFAKEFPKAARKLRLAIETDHDAARRSTMEYVAHVRQVIGRES